MITRKSQSWRGIGTGLIVAGVFLQAALVLRSFAPDPTSAEWARRLLGLVMGAVVVFYANAMPKSLTPLAQMTCDPTAEQDLRRFAAWSLALGGAAFAAASLLAPIENAKAIAVSALGASVVLVVARVGSVRWMKGERPGIISPRRLHELLEARSVTVIDVNSRESWAKARVPGALNLDPEQYEGGDLPADKDAAVVFYCSNSMCRKAPTAARRARTMGYRNVQVMREGIKGWVATDLPTESGR